MPKRSVRFRPALWRRWGPALAFFLLLALRWYVGADSDRPPAPATGSAPKGSAAKTDRQAPLAPGAYRVAWVIDGDTLRVDGDPRRLRLEGIDAPELPREDAPGEPWASEARRFLEQALGSDRYVRLEAGGTPADRYGRPLVFVWRQQDLLNEQLVRAGLARAALGFPFRDDYKQRLARAQREARAARRGIWSDAPPP